MRVAVYLLLAWVLVRGVLLLVPYQGVERLREVECSRVYLDRSGRELAIRRVDDTGLRRLYVPLGAMPDSIEAIVTAAEDARFRWHPGVDPLSVARALVQYARTGERVSGASTITMQLASVLSPRPDTVGGKLREMLDALVLDARLGKGHILELYVNLVPVGRNVEGLPGAARLYFGRAIEELTAAELAILAALPRNPARGDPWLNRGGNRAVAARLLEEARLPAAARETDLAAAYEALRDPTRRDVWPFEAPHFVELVDRRLDPARAERTRLRRHVDELANRFRHRLTLDLERQRRLEAELALALSDAGRYRIGDAAGILADPATGEVLAYAGSVDFFDPATGQIDGVQIRREPGSTLKPLLYAEAFEAGFTAATVLPDIPLDFGTAEVYVPANFNEQYHGPVRVREALAASLNVPAVYTLERISVARFADRLVGLGFESLEDVRDELGVSLALGGAAITLFELLQSYLSLYDDGSSPRLSWIAGAQPEEVQHWEPATAGAIRDIISANEERVMTFGRRSPLRYDFPVAIKTGTSNQFNNIWAAGFSADVAGGVWMGNFTGETVVGAPGSSLPARVLHELITAYSTGVPLPDPRATTTLRVCALSGMAATPACPNPVAELVPIGAHLESCDWHSEDGRVRYPQEYWLWANQYGYDLSFQEQANPDIVSPVDGAVYYRAPGAPGASQQARVFVVGPEKGVVRVDGSVVYEGRLPASFFLPLTEGVHRIELSHGQAPTVSHTIEVR